MDTENICPSCQKPLPANAPKGLCPECLMKAGFGTGVAPEPGQPSRAPAFVPPPVAEVGKLFPQFEVLELLGQGGMGAVYKARQPALDRLVALKILPPQTGTDTGFADRFTREARALAKLSHPNIVGVHEFGQAGGLHYFVMEYVEGLNLRQLEQAGKLSPREALKIIPQICDALQFAHDEGIVHRDIKPENVMLDKKGRVKITDFGLAKILGLEPEALRLTGAKDVMGTPHYMAPEQVEKPQTVDHRADIYSLGVVFYEMLTGELPLGKFQAPSKKVEVDVRLDEVVLHALEKEPERRYQQASQVKSDVETIARTPSLGTAAAPDGDRRAIPDLEDARQQLAGPALGITVATILTLLLQGLLILGLGNPLLFLMAACNVVPLIGARRMKQLRNHQFAVLSGILASLPGFTLALPFGIWALVVLYRREVREAFAHSRAADQPPKQSSSDPAVERARRLVKWPAIGLIATSLLGPFMLGFLVTIGRMHAGAWMFWPLVIELGLIVLAALGGYKLLHLESRRMALAGGIAGCVLSFLNFLCLPFAVWSLAVTNRRDVREAFGKEYTVASPGLPPRRPTSAWKLAVVMALVVGLMLAVMAVSVQLAKSVPRLLAQTSALPPVFQYAEPDVPGSAESFAVAAPRFGPVREVTLNDIDELRGGEALDLDSGKLLDLPKDIKRRPQSEGLQWVKDHGVDLLLDRVGLNWGLMTTAERGLGLVALPNARWDAISTGTLSQALTGPAALEIKQRGPWQVYVLATNVPPAVTFAFRAAGGATGLLQITGFTEHPNSARLRYKILQDESARPVRAPVVAGSASGVASAQQAFMRRYGMEAAVSGGVPEPASGVAAVKEKPALLAQAAPGEYRLELTNGVEFQVVAVASSPRSSTVWWRPDGKLLQKSPGERPSDISRLCPSPNSRVEFALLTRISGKSLAAEDLVLAFDPQPQYVAAAHLSTNDLPVPVTLVGFSAAPTNLTCKIGLASGPWERVATWDQTGTLLNNESHAQLELRCSRADDETCLKLLAGEVDLERAGLRLSARLKDGTYKNARTCVATYGSPHKIVFCAVIKGLNDSDVIAYELYAAPLHWAVIPGIATRPDVPPINGGGTVPGSSTRSSRLEDLPEVDRARAVALFNDIEDFGHEFDSAFTSKNLAAAQTGTRRLLTLLTNFNAAVKGTGYEFPAGIFGDVVKVRQALVEGDWEKARELARHNDEYAREFKRIGNKMVELARQQQGNAAASFGPVIERVLAGKGDANKRFIDLDRGKLFAATEFFGPKAEPSPEQTQKWLAETGIDAVCDTRAHYGGLVGFEMVASPVPNEEWDRLAPSGLDYYLVAAAPGTPVTMSGRGELPATFGVKTREGARGLLQIVALSTNQLPEVTIRYKLAKPATVGGRSTETEKAR